MFFRMIFLVKNQYLFENAPPFMDKLSLKKSTINILNEGTVGPSGNTVSS